MGKDRIEYPTPQKDDKEYVFTEAELKEIEKHVKKYPNKRSAIMPALWIAQEKFGWLPQKAIKLVADTLGLPYADVYGVATFYTMYLKEYKAPNLIDFCTCFTCGEVGGKKVYDDIREKYKCNSEGVSEDGLFWIREAECLGACDSAPVAQVNNKRTVFNINSVEDFEDKILKYIKKGELPPFESVPLKNPEK